MGRKLIPLRHTYRRKTLDTFQREAIWHIENQTSLLLSAPTGTGKTLIAEFLIDMVGKQDRRVIFTAPIKTLVNQKYQDFAVRFGKQRVGVATGDITINDQAPLLVATTEVFRNMLLRKDKRIEQLDWVIYDEIHYLDHNQRGTVWEESIVLTPSSVQMLGLSATVPNIQQIADWIRHIHNKDVVAIEHYDRAVPLRHLYFNESCQAIPQDKVVQSMTEAVLPEHDAYDFKAGKLSLEDISLPKGLHYQDHTRCSDLVRYVGKHGLFPALYFCFSRRGCESRAQDTAKHRDYLQPREKNAVWSLANQQLRQSSLQRDEIPGFNWHFEQWQKGVGVHHAGLLPVIKKLAEVLLEAGLIRILFATETFAVGVNMPVRAVCFDTLIKYDGEGYRFLTQQEYFQMAGRAGRRGMDRQGTVLSLVDFGTIAKHPLPEWNDKKLESIDSRFNLTFNLTLNLLATGEAQSLLEKSLYAFQNPAGQQKLAATMKQQVNILRQLGFLCQTQLTTKGQIGAELYVHELFLSELVAENHLRKFKPWQLAALAGSLSWEPARKLPVHAPPNWLNRLEVVRDQMAAKAALIPSQVAPIHPAPALAVGRWAANDDITSVLKLVPMDPGDFVQLCRRTIDVLRQLQGVTNSSLATRLGHAVDKIDRGVVQIEF